jgi:hypothetical protein
MKGMPDEMPMLMKSTSPLATWVRASGPPLNGTWRAVNPAASRSRSAAQWVALPTPADANVNEPFLAAWTSSLSVLIPLAGETTVTFGTVPKTATPARSRPAS